VRKEATLVKKIKHIKTKSLRKKAWDLQSKYIRQAEKGICYTCGVHHEWKEMQAGHYIHKDCLDFDNVNIHCQCVRCNKHLHGNSGVYAERLIAEYGEEAVAELRNRAEIIKKFSVIELEDLIYYYKQVLREMTQPGI
jgi:hypothetical protein